MMMLLHRHPCVACAGFTAPSLRAPYSGDYGAGYTDTRGKYDCGTVGCVGLLTVSAGSGVRVIQHIRVRQ
eukprot:8095066-Alexandrium_andersonii.AAC.1